MFGLASTSSRSIKFVAQSSLRQSYLQILSRCFATKFSEGWYLYCQSLEFFCFSIDYIYVWRKYHIYTVERNRIFSPLLKKVWWITCITNVRAKAMLIVSYVDLKLPSQKTSINKLVWHFGNKMLTNLK